MGLLGFVDGVPGNAQGLGHLAGIRFSEYPAIADPFRFWQLVGRKQIGDPVWWQTKPLRKIPNRVRMSHFTSDIL
jgi:hypothetical protein